MTFSELIINMASKVFSKRIKSLTLASTWGVAGAYFSLTHLFHMPFVGGLTIGTGSLRATKLLLEELKC